jgi:hypothetical protein
MNNLFRYAKTLARKGGQVFVSGDIFAKVLTSNDDSGRHGVLIPADAYSYFPRFNIPDPGQNATEEFPAVDALSGTRKWVGYKYYERYPERRITRLASSLNAVASSPRLLVFVHAKHEDGTSEYYFDCANSAAGGRFAELFELIFGNEVSPAPGKFIVRPVDSEVFSADPVLTELLGKFDEVKARGWIEAMRAGDTGIGYTFETLLDIEENNDQIADFHGIEIKCQGMKEGETRGANKINLFQAGPTWTIGASGKERIRILGKLGSDGLFACHSQVTTTPNNLNLMLEVVGTDNRIDLRKEASALGYWSYGQLKTRLSEKYSRAVFVKAQTRNAKSGMQFFYQELIYCEKPSIERFVELVLNRNIVFEFLMSEKPDGTVRNHGYPWRLTRAEFLDHLFAFQIMLRTRGSS